MPPLSPLPRPRPPPTDRSSHRIPLRQEAARPARPLRGDAPPRRWLFPVVFCCGVSCGRGRAGL
uniref:Uncharacterized protein n=1 Tax=Oryza nivara TaxID=4536 RepID=A0A0E0FVS2_ORYNI